MGFGELCFKQHFGPRSGPSWPSWAPFRYLEATAMLVEAIGQIFFGHVVGFASRNAFPPAGPRYWAGFCELCLLHLGQVRLPVATLVPSSGQLRRFWGQLQRFWDCVEGYMESFWTMLLRHAQKQPQTIPPQRSPPWPPRRNRRNMKNPSKTKISSKTLIPMAGRPKRNKKTSKNTFPKS